MRIKEILLSPGYTGFFFDDQQAIKKGATNDGFMYVGNPVLPGFTTVRQKGESINIQIILENGMVGYGDCAAVQYSGTGGRDPLFIAADYIPFLKEKILPLLMQEEIGDFRSLAEKYDRLVIDGKRLHTAIRYGITQALLSVSAAYSQMTMAELVRKEYNIDTAVYNPVPIFTQSGDDRYVNVDKMILKEADVLPHALINNVETKLGRQG
ncbi:MAG: methylaspartate ammonia-lyase, partial [Bacilli bacterium]|nr:methylaspartate ammonia-lyase [Bacilli bacterium]